MNESLIKEIKDLTEERNALMIDISVKKTEFIIMNNNLADAEKSFATLKSEVQKFSETLNLMKAQVLEYDEIILPRVSRGKKMAEIMEGANALLEQKKIQLENTINALEMVSQIDVKSKNIISDMVQAFSFKTDELFARVNGMFNTINTAVEAVSKLKNEYENIVTKERSDIERAHRELDRQRSDLATMAQRQSSTPQEQTKTIA